MGGLLIDMAFAWRLLRRSPGRAWLLVLCIAVGISARAFVGTVTSSAEAAVAREARPLLGGDLEIAAHQALTAAQRATISAALPPGTRQTSLVNFVSMVRSGERTRLVEVRAVESSWPLIGEARLTAMLPGVTNLGEALAERDGLAGAVAESALFQALGLRPGDRITLGQSDVILTAELASEPGRNAALFSLGPRLLIPVSALPATDLTGHGARIRHSTLALLPDPRQSEELSTRLAEQWTLPESDSGFGGVGAGGVLVRSAAQSQVGLSRVIERFSGFLRLLALAALLLGGVGVASLVGGAVHARRDELALFQILGASPGRTARILLFHTIGLALSGAIVGVLIGASAAGLILTALDGRLPITVVPVFSPLALLSGWASGLIIALAFAAAPLLRVRHIAPLAILRGDQVELRDGVAGAVAITIAAIVIAVIAVGEVRSLPIGLGFIGALILGAAVLGGLGWLALRVISRCAPRAVGPRLGFSNLARPGLRPVPAIIAIGLSALLFAALATWQQSVEDEFNPALRGDLPGLFVIDLHDDQLAHFSAVVQTATGQAPLGLSPVVTARYRGKVANTSATTPADESPRTRFFRNREQRLSWRDAPGPDERTISGRWPRDDLQHPERIEASLDAGFAKRIDVQLGDRLAFDVQGISFIADVVGLRDVRFTGLKPNFFILLNPAALAGAPATWISAIVNQPDQQRAELTRTLVEVLPNLTVLDIASVAASIRELIGKLVAALRLVTWFALAAGVAALAGVCLAGARERRSDGALLRTLGASDRTVISALFTEFAVLGLIAGSLGSAVGLATVMLLLTLATDLTPHPPWNALLLLTLGMAMLVATIGVIANWSVLRVPPLEVLRDE